MSCLFIGWNHGSSKNVRPRPSEPWQHGCFLVKTQVIGAAEDTTAVCLPADPPHCGGKNEWMVNYIFVRTLAAAHNDCPCQNCNPWFRYALANERRSAGVKSQLICSLTIQLLIHKSTDNSQGQQSTSAKCYPRSCSLLRAQKFDLMAGIH